MFYVYNNEVIELKTKLLVYDTQFELLHLELSKNLELTKQEIKSSFETTQQELKNLEVEHPSLLDCSLLFSGFSVGSLLIYT